VNVGLSLALCQLLVVAEALCMWGRWVIVVRACVCEGGVSVVCVCVCEGGESVVCVVLQTTRARVAYIHTAKFQTESSMSASCWWMFC